MLQYWFTLTTSKIFHRFFFFQYRLQFILVNVYYSLKLSLILYNSKCNIHFHVQTQGSVIYSSEQSLLNCTAQNQIYIHLRVLLRTQRGNRETERTVSGPPRTSKVLRKQPKANHTPQGRCLSMTVWGENRVQTIHSNVCG